MIKGTEATKNVTKLLMKVKKREGEVVSFQIKRISDAVGKAMKATGEGTEFDAYRIAERVVLHMYKTNIKDQHYIPTVEEIQDAVERELIWEDFADTAKAYILYRNKRTEVRDDDTNVPDSVKKITTDSSKYFKNQLAEFVYYRTYSRWIEEKGRRETWIETVDRYMDFMKENLGKKLSTKEYSEVRESILNQEAMPSMRLFQFAGLPARRTNVCAYNCSFIAPNKLQDFGEIMYILMCGSGLGFTVESWSVQKLPQIKFQTEKKAKTYLIPDSKEGWADSVVHGMKTWFSGNDVDFDFSEVRPEGARLKTMGGRSSGPEPLRNVLVFMREKILLKQGRRLSNVDVHDIVCKIGEVVVAGGVRRSALISLSDLDDVEVRDAKKGQFFLTNPQRMMANNSAVYTEKPTNEYFMDEWVALMKSRSGERGIFNRGSLTSTLPSRRLGQFKNGKHPHWGVNPCGEIILQSKSFCNLSEVVARANDTEKSLLKKIKIATLIGTYQSTLTNFGYLSKEWKQNCDKERLLGVSITGQWDSSIVRDEVILEKLRKEAIRANKIYSKKFGINESTCITAVKPSGTLSQIVDSSSGMHPRHSEYYIRRIRIASNDPLFKMVKEHGISYYPEVGQSKLDANTFVLEFPVKAPNNGIFKNDLTALEQLEYWRKVKKSYTEHNPSVTISVGDDEWIGVSNWVYENWELVGGLSFLPRDNHVYQLAPYEAIDKKRYEEMKEKLGEIDFSKIVLFEKEDATEVKKELACVSGICEI